MKVKNNFFLILVLLCFVKTYSQESQGGEPFLRELFTKNFENKKYDNEYVQKGNETIELKNVKSTIEKVSLQNVNNASLIDDAEKKQKEENNGINIYGKIIDQEIKISNVDKRFKYGGRYFNIIEVSSETAQSLQVYFKDFNLTKGATLYIYDAQGIMTLGSFTSDNNPKVKITEGYSFVTQPVIGNKIFVELSYPVDSNDLPILNLKSVVHGFKSFYSGAYGSAGNCNKNTACNFGNGFNDVARNIKSVGLILANYKGDGNYTYSCSGALINNSKQDGTPYFLTASHCVGVTNTMNGNWKNELLVLFNYEAKTCNSDGSDAPSDPSKSSVLGCELLVESPSSWRDFALLKLNTSKDVLERYKVCYAGWDNNVSAYVNTSVDRYGIHHPKGDAKKISFVKDIYPSNIDSQPIIVGDYLSVYWKDGIVEPGSSGSPLFNSSNRIIGNLSRGPNPNLFNCNSPVKYESVYSTSYARFSSNFSEMAYWLDPQNTFIQSIGPYCPSSSINIGVPSTYNPGGTNPSINYETSVDINRVMVHPSQTYGKKIYVPAGSSQSKPMLSKDGLIAAKTDFTYKIEGLYKILDCNKLKYINSDITIKIKNSANSSSDQFGKIIGLENDRVIVMVSDHIGNVYNTEIQSYKIVDNVLTFESVITISAIGTSNSKFFYDNGHLLIFNTWNKTLNSLFFNNVSWSSGSTQVFPEQINISIVLDKFFVSETGISTTFYYTTGKNKISVYAFQPNSPNYNLVNTFVNLYNNTNSTTNNLYRWDVINITKNINKANSYYINYIHYANGDPFNRILELDLDNQSYNHFNLGSDSSLEFDIYGWSHYNSFVNNNSIIQLRSTNTSTGENPVVTISLYKKNEITGVWYQYKYENFYQSIIYAINDKYILQHTNSRNGNYIYNLRELEYLFHPAIDNAGQNYGAYNVFKDITTPDYYKATIFGKDVYTNKTGNDNYYKFKYSHLNGYVSYSTSTDNKTIILSDDTKKIEGSKDVSIHGIYSVVMKPGFEVSSSSGAEFRATVEKSILQDNIPTCSFTFDDMLNPQLGNMNSQLYSKQNITDKPYYGSIIYKPQELLVNNDSKQEYKIYPNPTSDIINVESSQYINTIKIFSIDGKEIVKKDYSKVKKAEIKLSQYPTGLYIINVYSEKGEVLISEKIIKK